jgi:hypothetical protein
MIQPMLRITMIALVVVVALPVTGCGTASRSPLTMAQEAFARTVNLRAADVPELAEVKTLSRNHETRTGPLGPAIESCDGAPGGSRAVVGISSPHFSRSTARAGFVVLGLNESVQSTIYFMPSAALAAREYVATASSRASSCLMRNLVHEPDITKRKSASAAQTFFTQFGVSSLASPLRGLPIYWLRWSARLAGLPRRRFPFFSDYLGFAVGRVIVTLHETSAPHPFPATTERRVLSLLYSRATAHKL